MKNKLYVNGHISREQLLFMLNMRPELPKSFTEEERKRYSDTVDAWCEWLKDEDMVAPGTRVRICDESGFGDKFEGRTAIVKGNYVWIANTYGHGPTPDPWHPRVVSSSEMFALRGSLPETIDGTTYVPNPLLDLTKYSLVFISDGEETSWWPRSAFERKTPRRENDGKTDRRAEGAAH